MSRDAIQCLERGWKNVWANWELILLQWLGQLVVGALFVLGFLAPFFVIGMDLVKAAWEVLKRNGNFEEWLALAGQRLTTPRWEWIWGIAALLVLWGVAGIVYAYVQAGLVGTLDQGEAAADAAGRSDRPAFRVPAAAGFFAWGRHHLWPFFGLVNLWGAVLLVGLMPLLLGLVAVLYSGDQPNGAALAGVGCLGLLFTFVIFLASSLWYFVAQAELVQPGAGVFSASRRALSVLFRRPGAILLLLVLWICSIFAVSIVILPISSAGSLMLPNDFPTQILFHITLSFLRGLLGVLPQLLFLGAFVSLVRGESAAPRSVVANPAEVSTP